ncbi:hypothetical protein COU56_01435 [Candidatus Pacearchaeota archaeon CG10_big_fil_rev_8_21_14_0_10_31_9]|nr:MAG: hypothetical protein COU56_01435 [Candidatus Pacearchaeota archaeon CG10_big_fil_rev_8_21_14_0_10_31_9]
MVESIINTKKSLILTQKELEVINKKLSGTKLNQQDSNYLSKYIRPKLNEIKTIDAESLLGKLKYNQKSKSIDNKIINIITKVIKPKAIILYGSIIQNNYKNYKDIDILIVTKKKNWKKLREKYELISKIEEKLKGNLITPDIQIIDYESLRLQYPHNPSLIYQLKDLKIIYGNINIPHKIELSKLDLSIKLDWSEVMDNSSKEIYGALRNTILVRLLLRGVIDNKLLKESLTEQLGINILNKLKNNTASKIEKRLSLNYLKHLNKITKEEISQSGKDWSDKIIKQYN